MIPVQTPIPDGTEWEGSTGRTWTANGTGLVLTWGEFSGVVTVYQVRF